MDTHSPDGTKIANEALPKAIPEKDPPPAVQDARADTREKLTQSLTLSTEDELDHARESGEVSQYNCDVNYLSRFATEDIPLGREDVGDEPVVIPREVFETYFGNLRIITASGQEAKIDEEAFRNDTLIILPKHLGNRKK